MPIALYTLLLAAFCVGTSEFVVAGLLPEISNDLSVSIPAAGLLVTGYAIGVAVAGPIMAALTTRLKRKQTLLLTMAIFVAGHVICGTAPTYGVLMAGRIVISLSHGLFFGIGVIVASDLAPPGRQGSAIAIIVAGITIANILGVPGGTAIGQFFGWRSVSWVLASIGCLAAVAMYFLLPTETARRSTTSSLTAQVRALLNQEVYLTFVVIILMMTAFWCVFTYVSPLLIQVSGVPQDWVPTLLIIFGIGATTGAVLGGRLADQAPRTLFLWINPLQGLAFIMIAMVSGSAEGMALMLFLFGVVTFLPNSTLVNRLLKGASEAPELTSTLMSSVFNIGIATGALLGAIALDRGAAFPQLPWFGVGLCAAATAVCMLSVRLERRSPTPSK